MRGIARQKLGYFPLPQKEAERIRRFLLFREDCDAASVLHTAPAQGRRWQRLLPAPRR